MQATTNPIIAAVADASGEMLALETQSPSSSSSSEAERDAFETHWAKKHGRLPTTWASLFEHSVYYKGEMPADLEGVYFLESAREAWEAWQARATPPSLPIDFKQASEQGGWQLVPKEPTGEMLDALFGELGYDVQTGLGTDGIYRQVSVLDIDTLPDAYRAMLDVSPSPHPEEGALLLGGDEGGKAMGGAA